MKSFFNLSILLLSIVILGCSSSDDGNDTNQIDSQLLGQWYFGNPLLVGLETNNSFTFNANGEVIYSYWSGGADFDFLTETGTYSFEGDIMTMIFPEDVTLTFVQKVVFINDDVVEFQSTGVAGENAYEGDYFRAGVPGYGNPTEELHKVEFTATQSSPAVSIFATTTVTYFDGSEEVINSEFDSQNNILIVDIPIGVVSFELEFYIEDSSPASMIFYNAGTSEVIIEEETSGQVYELNYTF